jgi:hypothetical protein
MAPPQSASAAGPAYGLAHAMVAGDVNPVFPLTALVRLSIVVVFNFSYVLLVP